MDMVGDAIEQGAGEALAGEDGCPFLEGQVRGDDGGAALVAPAEDVEQQLAAGLRQGARIRGSSTMSRLTLASWSWRRSSLFSSRRLDHLVDQVGGGGEADGEALLAGGEAEGESDMRLSDTGRPEQDRVLAAVDIIAAGEIQHQHLVEGLGWP